MCTSTSSIIMYENDTSAEFDYHNSHQFHTDTYSTLQCAKLVNGREGQVLYNIGILNSKD